MGGLRLRCWPRRDEQAIAAVQAFKHSIDPDNVFAASNNFCGKAVPH
jgi:hypothetical protein